MPIFTFSRFSLLGRETASIIKYSGYDNSKAATSWLVLYLIYTERLGVSYGNHINIVMPL